MNYAFMPRSMGLSVMMAEPLSRVPILHGHAAAEASPGETALH